MGLFKRKAKTEGGQQVEETLVAEEPASEGAPEESLFAPDAPEGSAAEEGVTLAEEPVSPETFMTSEPPPVSAPVTALEPTAPEYPPELEPFVKQAPGGTILLERKFDRATKIDMESKVTTAPRTALREKTWHPRKKASLQGVHRAIDRLKVRRVRPRGGKWLQKSFKAAPATPRLGLELVPSNILEKRIVYETEGGFVVEVTYRDGADSRKKYFTVNSRGGREPALNLIRSGHYAELTFVTDETIANLGRPRKHAPLPYPPGQVNTYPITNKYNVSEIEGIGATYGLRLHEIGIHTTDQLRLMNGTVIANNLGTTPSVVQKWQAMSELLCIRGIGKQYAEVLVRAGIPTIEGLARQKPKDLSLHVNRALDNSRPRITGGRIQSPRAWSWILGARNLKKAVQPFPVVEP